MTTTEALHEQIGAYRLGSVTGVCETPGHEHKCIVEPTDDLLKVTVFRAPSQRDFRETFDVVHAHIDGLGPLTFYACRMIAVRSSYANSTITLLPAMVTGGHDSMDGLQSISRAWLRFGLTDRNMLPAIFRQSFTEGVTLGEAVTKMIYDSPGLRLSLRRFGAMTSSINNYSHHSVEIEEGTAMIVEWTSPQSLRDAREVVTLAAQLLAAFYTQSFRASEEQYDFLGRPEHRDTAPMWERNFNIDVRAPFRQRYGFRDNASLESFQEAFTRLLSYSAKYPHLRDSFWHASVHARSIKRVVVDSFLKVGQIAEEINHLMVEEGMLDKPHRGSSIRALLQSIHNARPFTVLGNWTSEDEFFSHVQDTRNLYAHGSTKPRERVLRGYDVNFAALTMHLHLFTILGELLGFAAEPLQEARDESLRTAHDRYRTNRRLGIPLGELSRDCGWCFATDGSPA